MRIGVVPAIFLILVLAVVDLVLAVPQGGWPSLADRWVAEQRLGQPALEGCGCVAETWDVAWRAADLAVAGTGGSVEGRYPTWEGAGEPDADWYAAASRAVTVTLDVEHVWQSAPRLDLRVDAGGQVQVHPGGRCVHHFEPKRYYLMVASVQDASLETDGCRPNRPWSRLDERLLGLGIGRAPGAPILAPSQLRLPLTLLTTLVCVLVLALMGGSDRAKTGEEGG